MSYRSRRAACVECARTLVIVAAGLCCTCYRIRRGRHRPRGTCIDCHRVMSIAHSGLCWTCYAHRRHPETRRNKTRAFAGYSHMFNNPGAAVTRLSPKDRAALTDIDRMLRGGR